MKYIAAINYLDTGDDTEKTVFVGIDGFVFRPSDDPSHETVYDVVHAPALVRRDVFDVGTTGGGSRIGYGELVLNNENGKFDWLEDVPTDGRALKIHTSDDDNAAYPSGYALLVFATMEQMQSGLDLIRFRIRDREVLTTRSAQTNKYGGTNVLPNGTDGLESDLKGKPKPFMYGPVWNETPVNVNSSKLVYQVNDGPVRDVTAVYDGGSYLTHGPDYASEADMLGTQPERGTFRVWKAGGMFRLATSPFGEITFDAVEGLTPALRTSAQVFKRFSIERAGVDPSQIANADIVFADTLNKASVGFYTGTQEYSVAQIFNKISGGCGAWWSQDVNAMLRFVILNPAVADEDALVFNADNIENFTLVPIDTHGLPVYRVTVRCVPNGTVQTSGLVGNVTQARRARLAQPYQDAIAEDLSVRDTYLTSPEMVVESLFSCLLAGQTEAARLLSIYKNKHRRVELTVRGTPQQLSRINLGKTSFVQYNRYGFNAGKYGIVLGFQLDDTQTSASVTVWI